MAWETGTAANHRDLMNRLVTFLSTNASLVAASQNWEVLRAPVALPFTATAPNGRIAFGTQQLPSTTPDGWPSEIIVDPCRLKVTATLNAPSSGTYLFTFYHGDWLELRIDGALVLGAYFTNITGTFATSGTSTVSLTLSSGNHNIDIRLISRAGPTDRRGIGFGWRKPGDASPSIVPAANLSDLAIEWGYNPAANFQGTTGTAQNFATAMLDQECALKGPGASGTDEIFVNLYTTSGFSADTFNMIVRGATGFSDTAVMYDQPGRSSYDAAMLLWEQPITYWFIANGRRFIVIAKVSTTYESAYAGLGLPYGLPTEFPYMLVIGTSSSDAEFRFSDTSTAHTSFWRPGLASNSTDSPTCLQMRDTAGVWQKFTNLGSANGWVYPTNATSMHVERPAPDGSYALTPLVLFNATNVYGELDGVYHVSGFGNASENTITIEGQDYLVVQGANGTTAVDYAAIKLE